MELYTKPLNQKGNILLELLLSITLCLIMLSWFTTEMIRLNNNLYRLRIQYKMETYLVQHVLEYERHESVLSTENSVIVYDEYQIILNDDKLCIKWEVYDEQATFCKRVYKES